METIIFSALSPQRVNSEKMMVLLSWRELKWYNAVETTALRMGGMTIWSRKTTEKTNCCRCC